MNFQKWLKISLERSANHDDLPLGRWLIHCAYWCNPIALRAVEFEGAESIARINDPYSPVLWDWLSELERVW